MLENIANEIKSKIKPLGVTRELDQVGRIVIPKELRKSFGLIEKTKERKGDLIDISTSGEFIVLRKAGVGTRGFTRRIDELGRITIPVEIVRNFGLSLKTSSHKGSMIEIYTTEDAILLKQYGTTCYCCGGYGQLTEVLGRHLCPDCLKKHYKALRSIFNEW